MNAFDENFYYVKDMNPSSVKIDLKKKMKVKRATKIWYSELQAVLPEQPLDIMQRILSRMLEADGLGDFVYDADKFFSESDESASESSYVPTKGLKRQRCDTDESDRPGCSRIK